METLIKSPERLGTLLLRFGAISEEDLETALKLQRHDRGRLGETLIEMGVLSPRTLLDILAERLGVKGCLLRHGLVDPSLSTLIDRDEAKRLKVLPMFKVKGRLTVAMVEPQRLPVIDRLAAVTGCEINPLLVLERAEQHHERYIFEHHVRHLVLAHVSCKAEEVDANRQSEDTGDQGTHCERFGYRYDGIRFRILLHRTGIASGRKRVL